jgi:site-specific DNA recombinase
LKAPYAKKLQFDVLNEEMTSQTTSDWVKMAEKERAKRGEFTGSFAPYGYDKVGKSLVIADDESPEIVRRIFNLYQQGVGM